MLTLIGTRWHPIGPAATPPTRYVRTTGQLLGGYGAREKKAAQRDEMRAVVDLALDGRVVLRALADSSPTMM